MLCHCHGQGLYDPREICEQYLQCRKLENARQPLGGSFEKEMESHWKMRLHVFPELSAKKTAISSAIQRRAMWQGLLWQKRKKKLMAVATQQSHHGEPTRFRLSTHYWLDRTEWPKLPFVVAMQQHKSTPQAFLQFHPVSHTNKGQWPHLCCQCRFPAQKSIKSKAIVKCPTVLQRDRWDCFCYNWTKLLIIPTGPYCIKRLRNIYSDIHREYFCDQDRIKHKPLLSLNSADEDPPYLSWG